MPSTQQALTSISAMIKEEKENRLKGKFAS